jgi:RNA polymerase sigma factor (sigma-70 family)
MPSANDMLEQYRQDRDSQAFAELMDLCKPLVLATCQRHLADPGDLDDAVQETFVKLARRADSVHGNVQAWLYSAAVTTAIDFTRRAQRDRRNLAGLIKSGFLERRAGVSWEAVRDNLQQSLECLDSDNRSMVIDRFFGQVPVRSIAQQWGLTPSAVTRRISRAIDKLSGSLRRMGYQSLEEAAVAGGVLDPRPDQYALLANSIRCLSAGTLWEQVRKQPLSSSRQHDPAGPAKPTSWQKVIRIGVLVSELSTLTASFEGVMRPIEHQLWATGLLRSTDYRLLSLVEPGTHELASVERGAREFGLTAGMIDATDSQALKLLDVIYLGQSYALPHRVLDAIADAVSAGVGLYTEGQVASAVPGMNDPRVRRLLLTDKVGKYHTPGQHGLPMSATVLQGHPILRGFKSGDKLTVPGCGPVFVPRPADATVLIVKDQPVLPMAGRPAMPPTQMPAVIAGKLGMGRVVIASLGPSRFVKQPVLGHNFVPDAIDWLAQPALARRSSQWIGQAGGAGKRDTLSQPAI